MSLYDAQTCPQCGVEFFHTHRCSRSIAGSAQVDIDGVPHLLCTEHMRIYLPGQTCGACAQRQRDTTSIIESRIADHDSEISGLRRQIIELRHMVLDLQRAHNNQVRP